MCLRLRKIEIEINCVLNLYDWRTVNGNFLMVKDLVVFFG